VPRTATRFSGEAPRDATARLMFALLLTLRGNALIYQGEELGLPEAQSLKRTELRDPVGDLYWPIARGRDGARTPMPWRPDAANLGFSTGKSWLPAAPEHADLTVEAQAASPNSMLAFAKAMIALRKGSKALAYGAIDVIDALSPLLAFVRTEGGDAVACVFNMGQSTVTFAEPRLAGATLLSPSAGEAHLASGVLTLGSYAVRFLRLAAQP
jgi:alpha-glucosidase